MATEDEIKAIAYKLWEEEGRPDGKHEEHYFRAAVMLEEREKTTALRHISEPRRVVPIPLKASTPSRQSRNPSRSKSTK